MIVTKVKRWKFFCKIINDYYWSLKVEHLKYFIFGVWNFKIKVILITMKTLLMFLLRSKIRKRLSWVTSLIYLLIRTMWKRCPQSPSLRNQLHLTISSENYAKEPSVRWRKKGPLRFSSSQYRKLISSYLNLKNVPFFDFLVKNYELKFLNENILEIFLYLKAPYLTHIPKNSSSKSVT